MSIDWKDFYPDGAKYEKLDKGWGKCDECGSYLHNLGPEYDPEDMQSYEFIVCPNCQAAVEKHNRKWHAPDGFTLPYESKKAFIQYLEATGEPLPVCIQEDLAWEAQDLKDEYEEFLALMAEMSDDDLPPYRGQL